MIAEGPSTSPKYGSLQSFADPEAASFAEEVHDKLLAAIPDKWAEVKHLNEEDNRVLEVRREWDRTRTSAGFGVITWPRIYGGTELTAVEQVLFHETWGQLEAPQQFNLLGYSLAGRAIIDWGSEYQREKYLPRILNGEDIWCEGFSEPNAGSDMAGVQTRATRTDHGWHIQGQKIWTTFSPLADRMYCLTKSSNEAPKRHNLSVFLLDMHLPGVEVRPLKQITGLEGFGHVFIDTDVGDDDMLGSEGDGWMLSSIIGANRQRGEAAAGAAARCAEMGGWVRQLKECLAAAPQRAQMAERVGELAIRVEGYRWFIRRTVEHAIKGRDPRRPQSIIKIYAAELCQAITECGVELGCPEHEQYWRDRYLDFRKLSIAGGPNEIYRNIIANRVLEMGRG
jgi:alkylation response protein AidB-like acyl-CoA dehydrogenase